MRLRSKYSAASKSACDEEHEIRLVKAGLRNCCNINGIHSCYFRIVYHCS